LRNLDDSESEGGQSWRDPRVNLAVTGKAFEYMLEHEPRLYQRVFNKELLWVTRYKVIQKALVFGRMNPHNKAALVEEYRKGGFTVAMVGDGANDTGALNAADVK
jgi:magnesium-transporting ATPase (P-type)